MERHRLNGNELAGLLGYKNPEKIYRLFRSDTAKPSVDILEDIANKFEDLDLTWLLTGKEPDAVNAAEIPDKTRPDLRQPSNIEPLFIDSDDLKAVPIVDINVAAGPGRFNADRLDVQGYISIPKEFLSKGYHLAVRNRGESMAPTLQDSSYLIIKLIDRGDWRNMSDEEIYVVSTREGEGFVKRLKVRWDRGFVVLMSDNPDKASHPAFNLEDHEINNIWHLECAFSFRFPNIHQNYYSRLQQLEDSVDDIRSFLKLDSRPLVHQLRK
jgi:phage repressor protein C with HTH and peptisase S24 domain